MNNDIEETLKHAADENTMTQLCKVISLGVKAITGRNNDFVLLIETKDGVTIGADCNKAKIKEMLGKTLNAINTTDPVRETKSTT